MSATILETLQNADYNVDKPGMALWPLVKQQIHNATVLLEKDYSIYDEVEPLLEKYGNVENVPEKE